MGSRSSARWHFHPTSRFESLAPLWDRLQEVAAPVPILNSRFIRAGLRCFGTQRETLAIFGDVSDPAAMAIFESTGLGIWRTFQPSQFPVGPLLVRADVDVETLLRGLTLQLPGFSLMTSITQLDPELVQPVPDTATSETVPYIETAWVEVSGSFEEYWGARGKNLRQNVKRQLARLADAGTPARLEVVEDAAQVAAAIAEYGGLEAAGWKAGNGTAVQPDNRQGEFYRLALEAFCGANSGRIYMCRIGDRIAAIDLCIEQAGVLVVLKTAYDESRKTLSPATLLRYEYFRHIFERGNVRRIEFYGRVMEWHTRWTDLRRSLTHVNHYRWRWLRDLRRLRRGHRSGAAQAR